jgi:hypothetical protein
LRDRPRRYLLVSVGTIFRTDSESAHLFHLGRGKIGQPSYTAPDETVTQFFAWQ